MRFLSARWRDTLATAPLVVLGALAVVEAMAGGQLMTGPGLVILIAGAAVWAGAWSSSPLAGGAVLAAAGLLTVASQVADPAGYAVADDLVFFLIMLGCPALIGAGWAKRVRQVRELSRMSAIRAAQVKADAEAARITETTRIAAEVQRSVVQTLTAVIVRAEGALGPNVPPEKATGDPEQAALLAALQDIEVEARSALEQLREHIGVLREPEPAQTGELGIERRTPARPAPALDRVDLIAALTILPVAVEVAMTDHAFGPGWLAVVAPLLLAYPLAIRRRHPLAAAALFLGVSAAISWILVPLAGQVTTILPLLLIAHAVGAHLSRWRPRFIGTLLLGAGASWLAWAAPSEVDMESLLAIVAVLVIALAAGVVSAASTARVEALRELVASIEEHRNDEMRLAAARQRQSIARDLHDSVASAATIVCLQASAAQTLPPASTAPAREALRTIADTARAAVREVRESLQMIEPGAAVGGVGDVASVLSAARRAGVAVVLRSSVPSLPPGLEAAVARLVREGLVNASRHAPGAQVDVTLTVEAGEVVVRVADEGPPADAVQAASPGTGTGLIGLAERVAASGGSLAHGPAQPGGYELIARLPVPSGSPA